MAGAAPASDPDRWRDQLSRRLAWTMTAVFGLALASVGVGVGDAPTRNFLLSNLGSASVLLLVSLHPRAPWRVRAWLVVATFAIVGVVALARLGFLAGPTLAITLSLVSSGILLGRRAFAVVLVVVTAAVVALGVAMTRGLLDGPPIADIDMTNPRVWVRTGFIGSLLMVTLGVLVVGVVASLEQSLDRVRAESTQRLAAEAARRDAERVAIQAQKMEALGRIAAGAAHDFNNHLTVISLHAELLAASGDPMVQASRDGMRQSIEAASKLARQLLVLGRKETRAPKPLSLRTLVEAYGATLRRVLPSDLGFDVDLDGDPWTVADDAQLHQALLNLVINARDAIGRGGRVRVRVGGERIDAPRAALPQPIPAGDWAVIEVSDDGIGMDDATLARAAEPFFTTKGSGGGTGLGLSTTAAIASASGGVLVLASEPGKGTRASLYLPRTAPTEAPVPAQREAEVRLDGRTLLFAEDGADARRLTRAALEAAGATVLVAADGDEALSVLESHAGTIDLLCTDAVMPGAPVSRLLERWAARHPGAPVVVCSGHVAEELARRGIEEGRYALVAKPFSVAELVGAIARQLAAK